MKCFFAKNSLNYFGHLVSGDGMFTDQAKKFYSAIVIDAHAKTIERPSRACWVLQKIHPEFWGH